MKIPRLSRTIKLKFPRLFRTKIIFQDFQGSGNFTKKIPVLSRSHGNPLFYSFGAPMGLSTVSRTCSTYIAHHTHCVSTMCRTTFSLRVRYITKILQLKSSMLQQNNEMYSTSSPKSLLCCIIAPPIHA